MTDEDRTAARLKGLNCLIKFIDGEELLIHVPDIDESDDAAHEWFQSLEEFMYTDKVTYFPVANITCAPDTIKYVRKI